jgi:hypothetical protein
MILLLLLSFTIGEKLEYVGKFSFLNLGRMTLEIKDTLTYQDHFCYHISSILASNSSLKFLFSLNDTIDVYTRVDDLLPIYYEEKINEGKYYNHSRLVFDHESLSVTYDDSLIFELPENTRDLVTFWYYFRRIVLNVGDTVAVNVHKSKKNYKIFCSVSRMQKIKTPLGEFNTILVSPRTEGKGVFGSSGGMDIWYSDDELRYPVQIKAQMKFGSIIFKLTEVSN